MVSSVEEIVLLQLAGRDMQNKFSEAADIVLAGAVMMDLALRKRIDSDLNRLFVDDPQSTGDGILDHALSILVEIAQASRTSPAIERLNLKTSDAIMGIKVHAPRYRDSALQRLVQMGIVRDKANQSPGRYQVVDHSAERQVRARLRHLILTDEIPDPRDAVLLSLIDACGLLCLVLLRDEIASQRQRVEQLTRLDLLGQAMTKVINEIRSTL